MRERTLLFYDAPQIFKSRTEVRGVFEVEDPAGGKGSVSRGFVRVLGAWGLLG